MFTKGMIAADFLGDRTGIRIGHVLPNGPQQEAVGLFFLAAIALKLPATSTARSWPARDAARSDADGRALETPVGDQPKAPAGGCRKCSKCRRGVTNEGRGPSCTFCTSCTSRRVGRRAVHRSARHGGPRRHVVLKEADFPVSEAGKVIHVDTGITANSRLTWGSQCDRGGYGGTPLGHPKPSYQKEDPATAGARSAPWRPTGRRSRSTACSASSIGGPRRPTSCCRGGDGSWALLQPKRKGPQLPAVSPPLARVRLGDVQLLWRISGGTAMQSDWATIEIDGAQRIIHRRPSPANFVLPWR